jgi:glycosyltransferase involved in cell wall biosynthesis
MLHQYFNTPQGGGPLRSYYLAKALVDAGIETVVITTHNHSSKQIKNIEGIEVHYLPIPYNNRFGFVKRISSFLKFVLSIVREAGQFKSATLCYAISTPLTIGLAALWIKKRYHIPYYFEVGDLWPEAPVQMGIIQNPVLKWVLYKLEKSIYKRAHAIVALSEAIKADIESKILGKKIDVIPNMADTDFYTPELKQPELEEKFSVSGRFVISYMGTMGLANGLAYIVYCAEASRQLPVHFILCGDGAALENLKQLAEQKALQNISFVPVQHREGVRHVMNVTDAVMVSYKPLPVLETGSPNKYFDGLAAGKLMIVNVGGWMKQEVEQYRCGIAVDPLQPQDFVEKLTPFINNADLTKTYQTAARRLAETVYSRRLLSEKFLKLLRDD